jgi:serine protease Do
MRRTTRRYLFVLALTSVFGANCGSLSSANADDSVSVTAPDNVVKDVVKDVARGDALALPPGAAGMSASPSAGFPSASLPSATEPPKIAAPTAIQAAITSSMPLGPSTIADIAQAVAPSVVSIEVAQKTPPNSTPDYPVNPFQFFFGGNMPFSPRSHGAQNMGSGFILKPDGYIVTNAHVVKSAGKISVALNDGRHFPGTVLGVDPYTDIAVVKIEADKLPVARLGTNKGLRPGDFCIAIGSPLGYDHTVTFGIISALERDVRSVNEHIRFIQTDAAINPGNSGGPLLNLAGDVIGINTAIHANAQNLGFSIPIDTVKNVIESLVSHTKIERPYLGIVMEPLDDVHLKSLGIAAKTTGVFISAVNEGPAQNAGVTQGDIIQKIDGKDVSASKDVQDIVHAHKVGDTLHLLVLRKSQAHAIACLVGQYPDNAGLAAQNDNEP